MDVKDPRIQRLAETLVHYSLKIKEGDLVLIHGSDLAAPLIREAYREVLRAGAHPDVMISIPGLREIYMNEASEKQLEHISPLGRLVTRGTTRAFHRGRLQHPHPWAMSTPNGRPRGPKRRGDQ